MTCDRTGFLVVNAHAVNVYEPRMLGMKYRRSILIPINFTRPDQKFKSNS